MEDELPVREGGRIGGGEFPVGRVGGGSFPMTGFAGTGNHGGEGGRGLGILVCFWLGGGMRRRRVGEMSMGCERGKT